MIGVLVAATLLAAACSSGGGSGSGSKGSGSPTSGATPRTAADQGTPDPTGVLRYGVDLTNAFGDNMDPGSLFNGCAYQELALIDQTVTSPSNTSIDPGVASGWTVDSPTQITFRLQPNLKFSDGEPLDAAAVKASIEHTAKSPYRTSLTVIKKMDVVNPTTLVMQLDPKAPQAGDVLWALSYLDGAVYSPKSIPTEKTKAVGSGPFKLAKYTPGQVLSLVKNDTSPVADKYKLAGVQFKQVGIGQPAITALKGGQVDMVDVTPEAYPAAKSDPKIGIAVGDSFDYLLVQFRMKTPPFNDPKVREAFQYAVDRDEINRKVFNGIGRVADQLIPKGSPGYDPALEGKYAYNPTKAKQLLAAAGRPNGVKFTMVVLGGVPTYERIAPLIKNSMKKAGFDATLKRIQPSAILQEFYTSDNAQAIVIVNLTNGIALWNNPMNNYTDIGFIAKVLGNTGAQDQLLPLVRQAIKTGKTDAATLDEPLRKINDLVMNQGLEVPIVFQPRVVAYSLDRVGGPPQAPIGDCRSNLEGVFIKKKS